MNQVYSRDLILFPSSPQFENYRLALTNGNWLRYIWNSFYVAAVATLLSLFINGLTGYVFARMQFKGRKVLFFLLLAVSLIGCGGSSEDAAADEGGDDGGLIKVGIINNDPNESGYRTANDKDMKETFTEENGYDASFAYSLKNDEQIASAQKFIQDGVDYLLLSAADTAGWDSVLQDAQDAGTQVILFDRTIDADESLYAASIVSGIIIFRHFYQIYVLRLEK